MILMEIERDRHVFGFGVARSHSLGFVFEVSASWGRERPITHSLGKEKGEQSDATVIAWRHSFVIDKTP
jgi:hypothetical protein